MNIKNGKENNNIKSENKDIINIDNVYKNEIIKINKSNDYLSKYGLELTNKDISNIVEKRKESLRYTNRIEFGPWIVEKIIKAFCDSSFVSRSTFPEILYELIDIFYFYKNETEDLITDDELIAFMRKYFDELAFGDLDYLSGTILNKMADNVLNGLPLDYDFESLK